MTNLNICPSGSVIGARVLNVSLCDVPSAGTVEEIEQALENYGVLVFPNQSPKPQQLIDFSAVFAPLEKTELEKARLEDFEEIFVVGNVGKGLVSFAPKDDQQELEWHTDHIHHDIAARASLLYALEVPEHGGDTLFACMYSAYNSLSTEQQQLYCTLDVINSASGLEHYLAEQNLGNTNSVTKSRSHKEVLRPLVREHPVTGRRSLYFGNQVSIGIAGWETTRARTFIQELTTHACQTAFQYRHQWKAGDAVLWDNRRVLHAGTPYDVENSRRLMYRTTFRETVPIERIGSQK